MEIILMRHAQVQHNVAKKQIKLKYPSGHIKKTPQYIALRTNPQFRDQHLSKNGKLEAQAAADMIDWQKVQMIVISPMKRCLQTCKIMLDKVDKKVEVKVQPFLKGRLSTIWGYGSKICDLKQSYPEYNFGNLNDQTQFPWYIEVMEDEKKNIYKKYSHNTEKLYANLEENYYEFKNRVEKMKKVLESYEAELNPGQTMLVISHSCVLRTLTAKSFDEKGKGISNIKFHNAKPLQLRLDSLFEWQQKSSLQTEASQSIPYEQLTNI